MKRFNEYLTELNVEWSRSYKQLPPEYIVASIKEANTIFDAMLKYVEKGQGTLDTINISDLDIPSALKSKYRGVQLRGTFRFSKFNYQDVSWKDTWFRPSTLKGKSPLSLKPSIDFEVVSKTNISLIRISAARSRFTEAWIEFKQSLHSNTYYTNVSGRAVTSLISMGGKGGLAALGAGLLAFAVPGLTWAALGAFFSVQYFVMSKTHDYYFLNDPLEVELAAINTITDLQFTKIWSKSNFIKLYGDQIVSPEKFKTNLSKLNTLGAALDLIDGNIESPKFYNKKNKDHYYEILYKAYVATMKGEI